ncbi:MAG: 4-deoxy-4-formamido-L-arabinose-phosphoundecaprenol deformylase [Candidatus Rokubacteria bacterium]|nr:4-deoxy-4-formamido-L-arabinose-phosphoundecaprenol deformylase [Candidatus Rokubacteria bacterium]
MGSLTLALRVDVDTRRGLREGVPRLLELFRQGEVRASFFVTFGPDRSGLAIRRAWRPSFLIKMARTNPLRLYGLRTLLSGTLLPAEPVGAGAPDLLRQIVALGHEVGLHGYDHVDWQDRVHRMSRPEVEAELVSAVTAYRQIFGHTPVASAAPGWRTTAAALEVQEGVGLRYASDVRGRRPFWAIEGDRRFRTLQIPTTLPTADELVGRVRDLPAALEAALVPGLNVFTLHAEVEGGPHLRLFRQFLQRQLRRGVEVLPVGEIAARLLDTPAEHPVAPVVRGRVPGRSGWVAVQGGQG